MNINIIGAGLAGCEACWYLSKKGYDIMNLNGLSNREVSLRINQNKVNFDTTSPSKSIKQILFENIFTLFNFINIFLAILIIFVKEYKNILFLGVVISNTLISVVQEIRAKKIVDKLSVISSSKAKVIRNKKQISININEIVLDDLICYELGDQIIVDSKIIDGTVEVDESFITGESKVKVKEKGDVLLSGSFIVSGSCKALVIHVGLDNYTSVISKDAKKLKEDVSSEIMKSLNKVVKYISISLIPIGILLFLKQMSISNDDVSGSIVKTVAALVGMIPEGLILLVSTVLGISVIKLSKYNVLVQDLYAIETLARCNSICFDKTGTLTEGSMEVMDVIPLDNNKINEIDSILEAISTNLNDNNPTFKAINLKFGNDSIIKTNDLITFSSIKKYSGISYDNTTYLIGAPEIIFCNKYDKYKNKINELSEENRVLGLISFKKNENNKIPNNSNILALIIIRDKIRSDVVNTINYFKENECLVNVISGDNIKTVSSVSKRVGIDIIGACDARSIKDDTDLSQLVKENNIFGRVKPEQKKLLIKAMQENGLIVAMTGDGVNDCLALKQADCAIAINDGSDAARNISDFVLLNSDFNGVPNIIKEGRRTINNIERSATLFLSKTVYSILLSLLFIFINDNYPFIPIQMSLISSITIGIPAFILALEPNYKRVNNGFLKRVVNKALPSGITAVLSILLLIILGKVLKLSYNEVSTLAVFVITYTGFLLIYKISKPLNFLRRSLLMILLIIFLFVYNVPFLRNLYSLYKFNILGLLILIFLMYFITRIFKILIEVIEKKNKFD